MPDAIFDTTDIPWSVTTTLNHLAYLIIPSEPLDSSISTGEQDTVSAIEYGPVFNLGEILNAQDIRMVRAALGLRKSNQNTLKLALLYSEKTNPLAVALWRWRLYQQ
jgi:hypothetical protein